jgi:hypothetical protein
VEVELFNAIVQAIKEVGLPSVISIVLCLLLWQQTAILRGIRDNLEGLNASAIRNACPLLREREGNEESHPSPAPLPQGRAVRSH